MRTIDVHSHFVPSEFVRAAMAGEAFDGVRAERASDDTLHLVHRQGYRYPVPPAFWNVQARLEAMDELSTQVAILSPPPTLFFYWADDDIADYCTWMNDAVAAACAQAPERLRGLATLPLTDPDAAVAELGRVGELGLVGAEIGPHVEGVALDDTELVDVLAAADTADVPLLIHPYYVGAAPGLDAYYLTNLVGNPLQTTVCATRLILSGVLDRLQSLNTMLVHAGGSLPYQIGRIDRGAAVRSEITAPRSAPSAYLHRFTYDTITHSEQALRFLLDLVGPDRVAFGTDFPFDMGAGTLDEQTRTLNLTGDELAAIASGTAARFFDLDLAGRR